VIDYFSVVSFFVFLWIFDVTSFGGGLLCYFGGFVGFGVTCFGGGQLCYFLGFFLWMRYFALTKVCEFV